MSGRHLINHLYNAHGFSKGREVADFLGCDEATISLHTNGKTKIGPSFILKVYDATDLSIEEIRALIDKK